jgi:MbtH protein
MSTDATSHEPLYAVIANSEDEYAIWPLSARALPGWRRAGYIGTREDCIGYVRSVDAERRASVLRALLETDIVRCS